jgi:hypothetical protein
VPFLRSVLVRARVSSAPFMPSYSEAFMPSYSEGYRRGKAIMTAFEA